MNKHIATALAALALLAVPTLAQDATSASTNAVVDLSDFEAVPDGVSVLALDGDSFKILSVATAPCKTLSPTAVSAARTVAVTKAKGSISRYLNETISVEESLEKEVSKVKVVSGDGTESATQVTARRVLVRIRAQSNSLLSGLVVLQTELVPAEGGPGGSFRAVVGVSSATLEGAETLDAGIDKASP